MLVPTEASVTYSAKLKLIDLAYDVAQSRSKKKPEIKAKIAQGTNAFLWLQALDYGDILTQTEREKIWMCLVDFLGIVDYAVAPVLGQTSPPTVLVGQGNTITVNNTYNTGTPFLNSVVDIGTETGDSFSVTSAFGCVWFYTIRNGSNQRSGIIEATWLADGSIIKTQHDSTDDIGVTTGVTLSVDYNNGGIRLRATVSTNGWIFEGNRYLIFSRVSDGSGGGFDDTLDMTFE